MNELNWKKIAVHDNDNVKGFFGDYRFLSNFHLTPIYFEGLQYPSSEHAYQAAKLLPNYRTAFLSNLVTPAATKKLWKTFGDGSLYDDSPEEWNKRKYDVMSVIVFDKFYRNHYLRDKLIETADKYLEETLWWKDTFWGVDVKLGGQNNLGIILMKVRDYWT